MDHNIEVPIPDVTSLPDGTSVSALIRKPPMRTFLVHCQKFNCQIEYESLHSSPNAKMSVMATWWASRRWSLQTTQCGSVHMRASSARPMPAIATTKGLRLKQYRTFPSGKVQLCLIG
jgi:hypothetical protein